MLDSTFDDDDDDDDDDDELFLQFGKKKRFTLFPARAIVRDPHHRKLPTSHEQDLNLRRT